MIGATADLNDRFLRDAVCNVQSHCTVMISVVIIIYFRLF